MQARSTITKESFRSTKPITELALNVLYQVQPPKDEDHKELVRLSLIEAEKWGGTQWWNVHFNQVDGPLPTFRRCATVKEEAKKVAEQLVVWIKNEGVTPSDICILYVGEGLEKEIEKTIGPALKALGATLAICEPTAHRLLSKCVRPPPSYLSLCLREPTAAVWLDVG